MEARIIVLNYNGCDLLQRNMPSVVKAARASSNKIRVSVLDNGSTDKSGPYIRESFPEVDFTVSPKNLLLVSYNDFLQKVSEPLVILLNNDIELEPDSIDYLLEHFNDDKVFFVAPKIMDAAGKHVTGGCMDFAFRLGLFRNKLKTNILNDYSFFVGSSAAYDRNKFLSLGGYDPVYLPGTYEDLDICYRSWQRGWTGIYDERSVAYHQDSASFSKVYGDEKRQAISARNAYICAWSNVRDKKILFLSIMLYPLSLLFNIVRMRFDLARGSIWALLFLPRIIKRRKLMTGQAVLSEKDIRRIFKGKKE